MIQGECSKCGHIFDVARYTACPACRSAEVERTFKPVDPLRTAIAIQRLQDRINQFISGRVQTEIDQEEKQYRIPKGEANQIYELKRMRKLIGKL
jgi:hypothetical protein